MGHDTSGIHFVSRPSSFTPDIPHIVFWSKHSIGVIDIDSPSICSRYGPLPLGTAIGLI